MELSSKRYIIVILDSTIDLCEIVKIISSYKENSVISFISDKIMKSSQININFCDYSVFKNHTMWKYTLPMCVTVDQKEVEIYINCLNYIFIIIIE